MNDADHDLARQQGADLGEAVEAIGELSIALNDAIACFTDKDQNVSEERIQTWESVLTKYGGFECEACGAKIAIPAGQNIRLCNSCLGVAQ